MQKTDNLASAKSVHRRVQPSATLNRKYVKRPTHSSGITVKVNQPAKSPKIQKFNYQLAGQKIIEKSDLVSATPHPLQSAAISRMQMRANVKQPTKVSTMTAKELKDQAIKKALATATIQSNSNTAPKSKKKSNKIKFGAGRIILALSCAAATVFAIAYLVNINMPDISLRVAAVQTGINASYPAYIPRDYRLSSITSEEKKVILSFTNSSSDKKFTITEERSPWDSNALLTNYVKETYGKDYSAIREQGLTIYINQSNAAWVNGGIVYKINADNGTLNNKQIRSIAVSL